MLKIVQEIFESNTIEVDDTGSRIPVHSHTTKEQCLFLQQIFDQIKPSRTLEVGFAYGISSLFILEKHREYNSSAEAHIVIEPDEYWGNAALHNIKKEGLDQYLRIERDFSDKILTRLYLEKHSIQYAYIDTTKVFDVVLQDFYFIDKILDVNGVIILDDCGGRWPGIQRVARFINTLPHYKILDAHNKVELPFKKRMAISVFGSLMKYFPFKKRLFPTIDFKIDSNLGLDYNCIAFQKTAPDTRRWDWDKPF